MLHTPSSLCTNLVHAATIRTELRRLGPGIAALLERHGIRITGVRNERLEDLSPTVKEHGYLPQHNLGGVFIWPERTLYLLRPLPGVLSHEIAHAIDYCLGIDAGADHDAALAHVTRDPEHATPPFYSSNAEIRAIIGTPLAAVSRYGAMAGHAESFAEAIRAYSGVNDGAGLYAELSSAKLHALNPALYDLIHTLFTQLNGAEFEATRHATTRLSA